MSVNPSVRRPIHPSVTFLDCGQFLHYCPCPIIRDAAAVYPALFIYKQQYIFYIVVFLLGIPRRFERCDVYRKQFIRKMSPQPTQRCLFHVWHRVRQYRYVYGKTAWNSKMWPTYRCTDQHSKVCPVSVNKNDMMLFVFSGFSFTATAWVKKEKKKDKNEGEKETDQAAAKQAQQPEDERVEQTYTTRFVDMFAHARNQIPPGAALHPYVAINSLMARSFR